jgi:hypothetical protein
MMCSEWNIVLISCFGKDITAPIPLYRISTQVPYANQNLSENRKNIVNGSAKIPSHVEFIVLIEKYRQFEEFFVDVVSWPTRYNVYGVIRITIFYPIHN